MKYFITLLILFNYSITNAQFFKGKIFLKDSTELNGLIKFKSMGGIKYKENENSKPESISSELLYQVNVKDKISLKKYRYVKFLNTLRNRKTGPGVKKTKGIKDYVIHRLKIEQLGKINLYSTIVQSSGMPIGVGPIAISYGGGSYTIYYTEKKEGEVIKIGMKFKKSQLSLFEDCPQLIKKINSKEIRKKDIPQIINYYNKECK